MTQLLEEIPQPQGVDYLDYVGFDDPITFIFVILLQSHYSSNINIQYIKPVNISFL
jgi:hypothetical protein